MGKGAVNTHSLAARTAQCRAHHLCSSRTDAPLVGTVLRLAAGEAVRVDRTFAHPTNYKLAPAVKARMGFVYSERTQK